MIHGKWHPFQDVLIPCWSVGECIQMGLRNKNIEWQQQHGFWSKPNTLSILAHAKHRWSIGTVLKMLFVNETSKYHTWLKSINTSLTSASLLHFHNDPTSMSLWCRCWRCWPLWIGKGEQPCHKMDQCAKFTRRNLNKKNQTDLDINIKKDKKMILGANSDQPILCIRGACSWEPQHQKSK